MTVKKDGITLVDESQSESVPLPLGASTDATLNLLLSAINTLIVEVRLLRKTVEFSSGINLS